MTANIHFFDYGIDLGTTNSCAAKFENSGIRVFQTRENVNTTRSAVHFNKYGRLLVGLKAYNALFNDVENVAVEFKRLMGTAGKKHFPAAGISLSPEELSAEVLKSIKQDVKRLTNKEMINAVITVPAAFGTLQCQSTQRAAELAGFGNIHLLQEPIAAAIAYGIESKMKEKYWMVYDWGGGTFDVAIVTTNNNRLTVLGNEGNNLLGGKDIDRLIVDNIFIPAIKNHYNLSGCAGEEYGEIFGKLTLKAEEAKIDLSISESVDVFLEGIGHDAEGEEICLEIKITKEEVDGLLKKLIGQTISLAQKALDNSNISQGELEKIVLVGGSSQIPAVRNALRDHFRVNIDFSLDPITVVARGAALYASMTKVEEERKAISPTPPGNQAVKLEYEPITAKLYTTVAGRFLGVGDPEEICISSTDNYWTSGWLPLSDKGNNYFEIEVRLQSNKNNSFILEGRDKYGNSLDIKASSFSIKHMQEYTSIAKPLVPHSLCIEYINKEGNRKLHGLIPKGTSLPAFASYTFKTAKGLRATEINEFITIKLWEGEHFDEPEANIWVANLYIHSENIKIPIHKGAEVIISLDVDESRRITIGASLPDYDYQFATGTIYKPTPLDLEGQFYGIKDNISEYFERLQYMAEKVPYSKEENRSLYDKLYREVEDYSINYHEMVDSGRCDRDKMLRIIEESKSIRINLSNLERTALIEKREVNLEKKAFDTLERVVYHINRHGDDSKKDILAKTRSDLHQSVEFFDTRGIQHATRKLYELEWDTVVDKIDYWRHLFHTCTHDNSIKFIDQEESEKWINMGRKADAENDLETLRKSVRNIIQLIKKDTREVIEESILPPDLRSS